MFTPRSTPSRLRPARVSGRFAPRRRAWISLLLAASALGGSPLGAGTMPHGALPPEVRSQAITAGGLVPGDTVPNFRLVDHTGRAQELYYEVKRKVIVLVFTEPGDPSALRTARAVRRLRDAFPTADVAVWQLSPGQRVDRTLLAAAQATYAVDDVPALHDGAQLVAMELGAATSGETFVLDAGAWTLAYRGPLTDADPANALDQPRRAYVEEAVTARLARTPVATPRVADRAGAWPLDLPAAPGIDYATQIAPIIQKRCVECHAPGGIAPRAFTSYADVSSRPGNLRQVLLEQKMPPWDADARYDSFSPNAGLTPGEAARLLAWVRAGAPRGTGPDPIASSPPPAVPGWPLGQPDAILTIPTQAIPATGQIDYRYIPVAIPQTRWLRGIVIRPGNRSVVHHALLFNGLDGLLASGGGLGGHFAGYVPGLDPRFLPAETGKRVVAGDLFVLQMHYTTTGKPETDRTQVGLYYFPTGETPKRELKTTAAGLSAFTIPPGAAEVPAESTYRVANDSLLHELNPHMHYRGKKIAYDAVYPDGRSEVLLNVPTYDFDWQREYRFAIPKRLPAGTVIRLRGAWDNSAENLSNPNPKATVRFGEQTDDEMFIGYIGLTDAPAANGVPPIWSGAQFVSGHAGLPLRARFTAEGGTGVKYRVDQLPAGLSIDPTTGVLSGTPTEAGRVRLQLVAENPAGAAMTPLDLAILPKPTAPIFLRQPQSLRGALGGSVVFASEVAADPAPTYQWYKGDSEFCFAETPTLSLTNLTWAHAGDYRLVVSNAAGAISSQRVTLSLDPPSLINLSTRSVLAPGQRLIAGLTITGNEPKRVLLRAIGPTLAAFGVTDALADPELAVYDSAGRRILANNDQGDLPAFLDLATATAASGAFALPASSRDAALAVTLPPGGYSLHVTSRDGKGGSVLAEAYEADQAGTQVINLSCRLPLSTAAPTLITGFVVGGNESRKVLVRAAGPALSAFGVTGALAQPRLSIYRSDGSLMTRVSGWSDTADVRGAVAATGAFAFAPGSADAAVVLTLPAGSYTAHVDGGTGETLVEVYRVP